MTRHQLVELVRSCTVIVAAGAAPTGSEHGSGFFVAPGIAVTCAHVLARAGPSAHLWWRGMSYPVVESVMSPPNAADALGPLPPFPDAAVVRVNMTDHPIVPIAAPINGSELWCYGMSRARGGTLTRPERDGRLMKMGNVEPGSFLEMSGGKIQAGMSGGPILDLDRLGVVGMTQAENNAQDVSFGVPLAAALAPWTASDLIADNAMLHNDSIEALRREQLALGALPNRVAGLIETAVPRILGYLQDKYHIVPPALPDDERAEWAARQLFRLSMGDLVATLRNVVGDGFTHNCRNVFGYVGACVSVADTLDSNWIPADGAIDLREELDSGSGRLIHLGTDSPTSATALVQRAMDEAVAITRCGGAYSAESVGGMPKHQFDDILASVQQAVTASPEEWQQDAANLLAWTRKNGTLVSVDPGPAPDRVLLDSLTDSFPGLPMVITRRAFTPPAGAENKVYTVAPAIKAENERWVLRNLRSFNDVLSRLGVDPFDLEGLS